MDVVVRVNKTDTHRLVITNTTKQMTGVNTYSWSLIKPHGAIAHYEWCSGTVEHVMEDGPMILVAKVAQAVAELDVPA